jgi:predicted alpha/beta-hydrolase family hydrolase
VETAQTAAGARTLEIITPGGPALAELDDAAAPAFLAVLTHGAGGGVATKDLLAVRASALALGGAVARVLQPYQLRGARAPGSAGRQDTAWLEIISALRGEYPGLPLIQGGRSNGARLACRTAQPAGARGVIALAFPLHPPGRPERSRLAELDAAGTDVLVINGSRDPFGIPGPAGARRVVTLPGETHTLAGSADVMTGAVTSWLRELLQLAEG